MEKLRCHDISLAAFLMLQRDVSYVGKEKIGNRVWLIFESERPYTDFRDIFFAGATVKAFEYANKIRAAKELVMNND